MKEDILEQLVDDYLQSQGYFTRHNLKFLPRKDHSDFASKHDSNHSDIDVLGINPALRGPSRVMAVSCKSWQDGFRVSSLIDEITHDKVRSGRKTWKSFRELVKPKWSEAFIHAVEAAAGSRQFTYVTAVTACRGDARLWEKHPPFTEAMGGNPIRVLSICEMVDSLTKNRTKTVASSQLGRTLQLLGAAGLNLKQVKAA